MSAIFGFTFHMGRMTEVLTPDIYRAHWLRETLRSPVEFTGLSISPQISLFSSSGYTHAWKNKKSWNYGYGIRLVQHIKMQCLVPIKPEHEVILFIKGSFCDEISKDLLKPLAQFKDIFKDNLYDRIII
jgi:hypothetical protein